MNSIWRKVLLLGLLMLPLSANSFAAEKTSIFVSIVPQKYFVEQIGKDLVDVQVMVQAGASPATYEPKPKQMADLSKTKIYFAIGVPYENAWLDDISAANPKMKIIHTDKGIKKLEMVAHDHHDHKDAHNDEHHAKKEDHHDEANHDEDHHDHGDAHNDKHHAGEEKDHHDEANHDEDHHDHEGADPHIWLSPALVKKQARTILFALQDADPKNRLVYEENFNSFIEQINVLDGKLKKVFEGKKGLQFMVFHPSWGYFANEYGLEQVPIEVEGKDPKPAQLQKLIQHAREKNIKVIFVQPQFSTKSAKVVAGEIKGQVAYADPLAEDWMANLQKVADKFLAASK